MKSFIFNIMDDVPCGDHEGLMLAMSEGRCKVDVESWTDTKEISYQQIKWWKGILLPALAKDSGESVSYWESKLKLEVLPEVFKPYVVTINGAAFNCIPSVSNLSAKQTNLLIEGSVQKLHEWGFTWVTLPDAALRSA